MNLVYLKEFLSLAETLNYQETAELMHLSPSSLSKHIIRLENDLGVNLFDRNSRTVVLNSYGEILRENAKQIIAIMDRCMEQINDKIDNDTYSLKIGYLSIYEGSSIHEMVASFKANYPYIDVTMTEIKSPIDKVDFSLYDYLFLDKIPSQKNVQTHFLLEDYLTLLVAKEHPLAGRSSVSLPELKDEKIIAHGLDNQSFCRDYMIFEKECIKAGFKPNSVYYTSHINTIIDLVCKNFGVSILNTSAIPYYTRDIVELVPLEHKISTRLYFVKTSTDSAKEEKHVQFEEYVLTHFFQFATGEEPV